jgi:hypothetical protein
MFSNRLRPLFVLLALSSLFFLACSKSDPAPSNSGGTGSGTGSGSGSGGSGSNGGGNGGSGSGGGTGTTMQTKVIGIYTVSAVLNSNNQITNAMFSDGSGNVLKLQLGTGVKLEIRNNNTEPTIDLPAGDNARAYYSNIRQGNVTSVTGADTTTGKIYFVATGVNTTALGTIRLVMIPCQNHIITSGSISYPGIVSNGSQITNAFISNTFNTSNVSQLQLVLQ